jgi:hypothetical protein
MKKLPIGIQSFEDLRSNDYLYVDKTEHIYRMITSGKVYFLSRPRRFGKSLLISAMEALFKGRKELFGGLWIEDRWDWEVRNPVIRIDWTKIKHATKDEMEADMKIFLQEIAVRQDIKLLRPYASSQFGELIEQIHLKTGQKSVVLIDEYDIPILDAMGKSEIEGIQAFLQDLYKQLKANDEHLRLIFLTGVSKFARLSIFSTLNNVNDITIDEKYATLCGYTQEELAYYFSEHIDSLAEKLDSSRNEILDRIKKWYDGYSWNGKVQVYNPFSTLLLFEKSEFSNYWFTSGTPTFLMEQLKKRNQIELVLEPVVVSSKSFDSFDPNNIDNISLLFQSGYVTIKEKIPVDEKMQYRLEVPNAEVRDSIMEYLLSAFSYYPLSQVEPLIENMSEQIRNCDAEGFAQNIRIMLQNIPYTLQTDNEKYYHSLFLSWMYALGFKIDGEIMTGAGRIDAVLELKDMIVISELKYHGKTKTETLLRNAMKQIHDRRYYEKYLNKGKKILLTGLAFSGKDVGCRMELINNRMI